MLIETIELLSNEQPKAVLDFLAYLISILNIIVENGHDPKPIVNCISKNIRQATSDKQHVIVDEESFYNYLFINLAEVLHVISPFYLVDIIRLIKVSRHSVI